MIFGGLDYLPILSFPRSILNHPELFDDAATGRKGKKLIKRGRELNDHKLWNHVTGLLDESKTIVTNIQNDPTTKKLRSDMKRLIQDVMLDEKGNVVLKVRMTTSSLAISLSLSLH